MRQNKFQLAELLGHGLLKQNPGGVNQKGFLELVNLRPVEGQLVYVDRYEGIEFVGNSQAFTTNVGNFLCTEIGIYKIVAGELVDFFETEESENNWTCADFTAFIIFSNGVNTVFAGAEDLYADEEIKAKIPVHKGVVAVGGQAVIWDGSVVRWSRINNLDFSLSNDNESGYHDPQVGIIQACVPFEKGFLALGDRGVARYLPSGVTFAYKKISTTGIDSPQHAVGVGELAYYVDVNGDFNIVKGQNDPEVIGYRWLFENKSVKLFYSDQTKEVWIQNVNGNYVFTGKEMYQISLLVSGVYVEGGKLKIVKKGGTQTRASFETTRLDFGISGLKTISETYTQDSGNHNGEVAVTVYSPKLSYSKKRRETYNGVSYPHITGEVLSVRRTIEDFSAGAISNLHIQTIRVDGRSGLGYTGGQE